MRSSHEPAGYPFAANFFVQKVFPAPDMPINASRSGFFLFVSAFINELPTIAWYQRPQQPAEGGGPAKILMHFWNLSSRTACGPLRQVIRLKRLLLLQAASV